MIIGSVRDAKECLAFLTEIGVPEKKAKEIILKVCFDVKESDLKDCFPLQQ